MKASDLQDRKQSKSCDWTGHKGGLRELSAAGKRGPVEVSGLSALGYGLERTEEQGSQSSQNQIPERGEVHGGRRICLQLQVPLHAQQRMDQEGMHVWKLTQARERTNQKN
jgi:hypothetical protein